VGAIAALTGLRSTYAIQLRTACSDTSGILLDSVSLIETVESPGASTVQAIFDEGNPTLLSSAGVTSGSLSINGKSIDIDIDIDIEAIEVGPKT